MHLCCGLWLNTTCCSHDQLGDICDEDKEEMVVISLDLQELILEDGLQYCIVEMHLLLSQEKI